MQDLLPTDLTMVPVFAPILDWVRSRTTYYDVLFTPHSISLAVTDEYTLTTVDDSECVFYFWIQRRRNPANLDESDLGIGVETYKTAWSSIKEQNTPVRKWCRLILINCVWFAD